MWANWEKIWTFVSPALWPFGLIYGGLMYLRRIAYAKGFFPAYRPRAVVIGVGNLSLGGEGKTPLVCWLAEHLRQMGLRVAILTRGYKGRAKGVVFASRGEGPLKTPTEIGDEAYLLALKTKVPVVVARDRVQGAFWAIKEFEAEVLILDDGFQHLRLERDLDLVVFSATCNSLKEKPFPAGRLREPKSALKAACAFVLTKTNLADASQLRAALAPLGKPIFEAPFIAQRPYLLNHPAQKAPAGVSFLAFAGLGDPQAFKRSAERTGEICAFLPLPDHVTYTPRLIEKLRRLRDRCGAQAFLTTEKDAVKLAHFGEKLSPCYVLPTEAAPEQSFAEFITTQLKKLGCLPPSS